jgi:L-ribulose-5-phosphate 3-epimerase UlaE
MAQQTAVEWLHSLHKKGILIEKSFEMAKEMEKEQINKACYDGYYKEDEKYTYEYYNETYNK